MNPFDRMPGPGPRGDRDGFGFLHLIGAFLGIMLVLFAVVAIVLLLWNSFTVRTEVRALRAEFARLSGNDGVGPGAVGAHVGGPGSAGTPAYPASAGVNTGEFAVPPPRSASAAPVGTLAVPPATTAPTIPAVPPVPPVEAQKSAAAVASNSVV